MTDTTCYSTQGPQHFSAWASITWASIILTLFIFIAAPVSSTVIFYSLVVIALGTIVGAARQRDHEPWVAPCQLPCEKAKELFGVISYPAVSAADMFKGPALAEEVMTHQVAILLIPVPSLVDDNLLKVAAPGEIIEVAVVACTDRDVQSAQGLAFADATEVLACYELEPSVIIARLEPLRQVQVPQMRNLQ